MRKTSRQKGQSLLEAAIAIGLAGLVVTALAIVTLYGLRNSQFSRNQAQATKLAQEGLEQVRSIRSRDYVVCYDSTPTCYLWGDGANGVWVRNFISSSNGSPSCSVNCNQFILQKSSQCVFSPPLPTSTPFCLKQAALPEAIPNSIFTRQITIEDQQDPPNPVQNRVVSKVTWTDSSGTHDSQLITVLSEY